MESRSPSIKEPIAGNNLFPVFLKLENLRLLVIGGGNIGLEKLLAVFQNSPLTKVRLVTIAASEKVTELCENYDIDLQLKPYEISDLREIDVVIAATGDLVLAAQIRNDCRLHRILVNVADTPDLCDFYLGAVVKKGDLKIAISTNGKSPTIAKRIKETLQETMPDTLQSVMENMNRIRLSLSGDFTSKVEKLNQLSSVMKPESLIRSDSYLTNGIPPDLNYGNISNNLEDKRQGSSVAQTSEPTVKKTGLFVLQNFSTYALWLGFALLFMVLGALVFKIPAINTFAESAVRLSHTLDAQFYWMIATGFAAQIIAGALGMGYGVLCTSILLSLGISLPAISSSIHTAETFASGISGFSHYKFGNVDNKLFKSLLLPGIAGAVAGAIILSLYGDKYASYIRPVLALYTLFLGFKILLNAFQKKELKAKILSIPLLAGAGGFIDSFGGGGWGPLVTSSFIAQGRNPRIVVGTVSLGKFFVSAASAVTFFAMLGISNNWQIIAGLLIGGITAAPLSARLAGLLPNRPMFISVGILVILCSLRLLYKSFF